MMSTNTAVGSTEAAKNLLQQLEDQFFAQFALERESSHKLLTRLDKHVAPLALGILAQAVMVQGRSALWDGIRVRAKKAVELLSKIPTHYVDDGVHIDLPETRRLLWQAVLDGVFAPPTFEPEFS